MPRPYPVVFLQKASVSDKSSTSAQISGAAGSLTFSATSRNPGSPSCRIVRIAIVKPLRLSHFRPFPFTRFRSSKHRFNHRHIRNRILERYRNLAALANRPRERIPLNRILIANGNHFYPDASAKHISSIINKNSCSTVRRRVKWYLDLHPPLCPQKLHPLVPHQLLTPPQHPSPRS